MSGYPPQALAVRRGEPEVSHAVLAHVYWTNQARADIALKGLPWAEGHAEGLRIASSLGSCTSEVMERAVDLTDRPDPYLAADAAWVVHENEAEAKLAAEMEAGASPALAAREADLELAAPEPVPEPFVPDRAAAAELALEHRNLRALEGLTARAELHRAVTDPYGVAGLERPGPDCPIDPVAHEAATRLIAHKRAVAHTPAAPRATPRTSSTTPKPKPAKTLRP